MPPCWKTLYEGNGTRMGAARNPVEYKTFLVLVGIDLCLRLQEQLLVFYDRKFWIRRYVSSGTSPERSAVFGALAQRSSNFSLWRVRGRHKLKFELRQDALSLGSHYN